MNTITNSPAGMTLVGASNFRVNSQIAKKEDGAQLPGETFQFTGGAFAPSNDTVAKDAPAETTAAPQKQAVAAPVAQPIVSSLGNTVQLTSTGALMEFAPEISAPKSLTPADLNFSKAADVISSAQKFILPVPNFADGGEPLVYPEGAKDKDGKSIGGTPIADWEGKPIGDKGVVFFNAKDQAWQAVKGDGEGVVIMNQVSEGQAKDLLGKVGGDPGKLSLEQFKEVLTFAAADGLSDMYNSDRSFIKSKMNPLETSDTGIPQFGLYRRDDRDVCNVLYVEGEGEFKGPKTTHHFDNGAVILRQADKKAPDGFDYRLIQPETFVETYSNKNGGKINLDALPRN